LNLTFTLSLSFPVFSGTSFYFGNTPPLFPEKILDIFYLLKGVFSHSLTLDSCLLFNCSISNLFAWSFFWLFDFPPLKWLAPNDFRSGTWTFLLTIYYEFFWICVFDFFFLASPKPLLFFKVVLTFSLVSSETFWILSCSAPFSFP